MTVHTKNNDQQKDSVFMIGGLYECIDPARGVVAYKYQYYDCKVIDGYWESAEVIVRSDIIMVISETLYPESGSSCNAEIKCLVTRAGSKRGCFVLYVPAFSYGPNLKTLHSNFNNVSVLVF